MTIGTWHAPRPAVDVFEGVFAVGGQFVRLDLELGGLVNPPGSTDPLWFDPFAYGDHPVYGFVEVDIDADNETGGELDAPEYRYLGSIVRFGGHPSDEVFHERVALDASAFDGIWNTEPQVERSGEEFHLALLGHLFGTIDIVEIAGNGDFVFDAGETWNIEAPWFHRAHGYESFSLASGGAVAGEYAPPSYARFRHDPSADTTIVSVVFPLTNLGSSLMREETVQPNNSDPSDQASVLEALVDLATSAAFLDMFPTGRPEEEIIIDWYEKDPESFLDPTQWRMTALLGSSYTAPDPAGEFFVWSDAHPDVIRGDVNGENGANDDDRKIIGEHILEFDAADGSPDGMVTILDFATDFSVFDVNHDGYVNDVDTLLVSVPGDLDADDDADFADFQRMQTCFSGSGIGYTDPLCSLADLDADGDVDAHDVKQYQQVLTGPGGDGSGSN